jgi:hypothetical protein
MSETCTGRASEVAIDIDKIIQSIDSKEYTVEAGKGYLNYLKFIVLLFLFIYICTV